MKFGVSKFQVDSILIPLLNVAVPAGFPSPALDYLEERIDLAKQLAPHPLSTFYVHVQGDSMIDACIPPHAILVVDKSLEAKNGDIVVAYLNGDFTVKYIQFENKRCLLVAANKQKKYPSIEISEEMDMCVWGVVTNVIIDTKHIRKCML